MVLRRVLNTFTKKYISVDFYKDYTRNEWVCEYQDVIRVGSTKAEAVAKIFEEINTRRVKK